jgi:catechol 2,3-dioxygenase-like lactoylglutathione lyase family enzyme
MLGASKIVAFAATVDSARSRSFYERVLGLRFISEDEFAVVYDVQGVELRIQKVRALVPQPHTQLGWSVSSIEDVVQTLQARGVWFERYSLLEQDSQGIWTSPSGARIAWLRDPDGNVLSVTQPAPA